MEETTTEEDITSLVEGITKTIEDIINSTKTTTILAVEVVGTILEDKDSKDNRHTKNATSSKTVVTKISSTGNPITSSKAMDSSLQQVSNSSATTLLNTSKTNQTTCNNPKLGVLQINNLRISSMAKTGKVISNKTNLATGSNSSKND
jgi:hypothetical protein